MMIDPHDERHGHKDPRAPDQATHDKRAKPSAPPATRRPEPNVPNLDAEPESDLDRTLEQTVPASDPPPGPGGH